MTIIGITNMNLVSIVQFVCLFLLVSPYESGNYDRVSKSRFEKRTQTDFDIHGPFTEAEYLEMKTEAQNLVDFILMNNSTSAESKSSELINRSGVNKIREQIENPRLANHTDSFLCKSCLWTFTKFHNLMEKKYGLRIFNEFLAILCTVGMSHSKCHDIIDIYSPTIIDSVIEHYINAEYICTNPFICKYNHFQKLDPDEYARELLKDKPPKKEEEVDSKAETWKVLHVTDIHTDIFYTEGTVGMCADPLCCREENGQAKTQSEAAGFWGYQGKCDIPLRTLDLFVETVVNEIKPDFIIWTGDNPPHNPWAKNKDEVYNITKIFTDLLYEKYQYKSPVFVSLGNHEENIADLFNPFDYSREEKFLKSMGGLFKQWFTDEEYEFFVRHGFYTKKYKDSNLRIISMNSYMCDVINFFLMRNPTDPGNQFEWLENVLRQAEKDGEYVFMIGHIPPGDSTFLSECSRRYNAIVDRFSSIIRGQFFGHTHYDEFRIITEYFNSTNIAGLVLTAPSLTTYTMKNPSFRVYEVDSNTKIVKDYSQYRLNLTEANLTPEIKPQFTVSYTAKESFNIKHLNDYYPFKESISRMSTDKDWFDFITDAFYADGVEKLSYIANKRLPKFLTCRFNESVFDLYFKCTGYRTWDSAEYVDRFLEMIIGQWYVKVHDIDLKEGHWNQDPEEYNGHLKFLN